MTKVQYFVIIFVLLHMTLCAMVKVYWCFGGTCCRHHQAK